MKRLNVDLEDRHAGFLNILPYGAKKALFHWFIDMLIMKSMKDPSLTARIVSGEITNDISTWIEAIGGGNDVLKE